MAQEGGLTVALGTHVEVELIAKDGASERLTFDPVLDEQADFANGFLGVGTPLAQAIWNKEVGEIVPYQLGDVVSVRVVSVTAAERVQEEDVAAKRQAVIQKAVASQIASAIWYLRWRLAPSGAITIPATQKTLGGNPVWP